MAAFDSAPVGYLIDDGTVSIGMALTLFMIPASKAVGGRLLDWDDAKKIPWGILLLFGGGLAIAKGFTTSGLSGYVASQLQVLLGDDADIKGSVNVGDRVSIGARTVIKIKTIVGHDTSIGTDCLIKRNVQIGHDVLMGNNVTVELGAVIPDYSVIDDGATVP